MSEAEGCEKAFVFVIRIGFGGIDVAWWYNSRPSTIKSNLHVLKNPGLLSL